MDAVYIRVSTEEQEKTGYSLASQADSCRNRLLSLGCTDIKVYEDGGFSGEFLDRPALNQLREDMRSGLIKNLCIYDPDRLSRNLTNQLLIADEIDTSHVNLLFVTGDYDASPEGKLFFQMRGAISAFEKEKIKERTSRGRKQKGLSGKVVIPGKPYGYDFDKESSQYVINEEEAKVVRLIYDLYVNKKLGGARVITLELAKLGFKGRKNGKPISIDCVDRVLKRDIYYGQHYIFRQSTKKTGQNTREIVNIPREQWIPITAPAIISYDLWQQAQEQRNKNRVYASRNTTNTYLLQKVVFCSQCGRGMAAATRPATRKSGKVVSYSYYHCITKESNVYATMDNKCVCRRIPTKSFDDQIWELLVDIANGRKNLDDYLKNHDKPDYSSSISKLTARQSEIKKKQSEIMKWHRESLIDSATAEHELKLLNKELTQITSALNDLLLSQNKTSKTINLDPKQFANAKTFEDKRRIILGCGLRVYADRQDEVVQFYFQEI